MTKKLILRLALLAVTVFSVYSCRIEDDVTQNTKEPQNKFAAFTQQGNEKVNFPKAFEYLFNRYYELKDAPVKNRNTAGDSPYTDFRFHSQLMEVDNGDKAMLFPVIKGNKVIGLMIGLLEKEETYLRYYEIAATYDQYSFAVNSFQKLADKYSGVNSRGIVGSGSNTDIPEIIVGPPRGGGGMYFPPYDGGGGGGCTACPPDQGSPSGGCPKYGGCTSSGGSGIVNTPPTSTKDPCSKLKAQTTSTAYKEKIAALDKPSVLNQKKETGFSESKSGTFTQLQPSASTNNSDGMIVPVSSDTKGYMHTHVNDYETGKYTNNNEPLINQPIRMFSPADVNTLMTMAGYSTDGNYGDLYGTMVSSYGNYTIKFTGTASDIKTGFDTEEWRKSYLKYKEEHDLWSLEKLFLNFLKDKMNVKGVELYKIKSNGTVQKKTLNSTNNVQSNDCPQ